jgi:hypothetical protein
MTPAHSAFMPINCTDFFFGRPPLRWAYGLLFVAWLLLMATALYAAAETSGPSAWPMLMLLVFVLGFLLMLSLTTVHVVRYAGMAGYGLVSKLLFIVLTWLGVGCSWTFLFWATDPNYPEQLMPGRVLFTLHGLVTYIGNLWLLWHISLGQRVAHLPPMPVPSSGRHPLP